MRAKGLAARATRRKHSAARPARCQQGAVVLACLILVLLLAGVLLADAGKRGRFPAGHGSAVTRQGLTQAKRGLIAWAVTLPATAGSGVTPGLLPFPDRHRDGNYDGRGDCVTFGLNDSHLLGRLPWAGDATPCPRASLYVRAHDGAGEDLWYAVSRNLLARGRAGPVNPDMGIPGRASYPWIRIREAGGSLLMDPVVGGPLAVAAVIMAPGAALEGQARGAPAPGPEHYLDRRRVGALVIDNADADGCPDIAPAPCSPADAGEEFILHPAAPLVPGFNDRLAAITVNELMRAVEKRVLGEAAAALARYRTAFGVYPWLAGFRAPRPAGAAPASFKSTLSRSGHLAVHLRDEVFATGFAGVWRFRDSSPDTLTHHTGDARLVPPLADVLSGVIQVPSASGRCRWSDWTVAECSGSRVMHGYFRADLGRVVTRIVEVALRVVDAAPRVTAPDAGNPRRRSLAAAGPAVGMSGFAPWNLRITDDDGVSSGRRELRLDGDTFGEVELGGIRYDLSVVYDGIADTRDEVPEWLAENDWHHFLFAAVSADAVPGGDADGDGDCATPVNTCLTLRVAGRSVRSDLRALLLSSGTQWTGQDRSIGDCNGDGVADDFLCAYFEGDNGDRSTTAAADTYARDPFSARFNDQLRIVEPRPP